MKFTIVPLIVIACILAASAADETALGKSKGCFACHQVSAKVVGPAYKDVAKKYTAKDADKLVKKVLNGGSGIWGAVPMPSSKATGLSEADAKKLVGWILTLK